MPEASDCVTPGHWEEMFLAIAIAEVCGVWGQKTMVVEAAMPIRLGEHTNHGLSMEARLGLLGGCGFVKPHDAFS